MKGDDWLAALRRYLAATAVLDLVWESVQLPLYTIWRDGTVRAKAFAVLHCTGGDLLIALAFLVGALVAVGNPAWPGRRFGRVAMLSVLGGLAYTVFSEWLNVEVRRSWAYSPLMPILPPFGTGLSPVLQWLAVPTLAFGRRVAPVRIDGHDARHDERRDECDDVGHGADLAPDHRHPRAGSGRAPEIPVLRRKVLSVKEPQRCRPLHDATWS